MTAITAADLKRRGIAAIEEGLNRGEPLRLMKDKEPVAVVLSMADYERLLAGQRPRGETMSAVQWLLAHPSRQTQTGPDIDTDLDNERNTWGRT